MTILCRGGICLLSSLMLIALSIGAQGQEIKGRNLKFAFSLTKDHPLGAGAQKFAELVAQKSA